MAMNCPNCGARILDGGSFCERCGLQVGISPYKSFQPRPQPAKDNKVLWIIAIVVIVVVVVPIVLSAVMYYMVVGFGTDGPQTPAASLTKSSVSNGVKLMFSPISTDTQWGDVRILLADADHTASWSPMTADLVSVTTATWIGGSQVLGTLNVFNNVTDLAGNGNINLGDFFTLTTGDGAFSSAMTYTVTIVYNPTGSEICHLSFTG